MRGAQSLYHAASEHCRLGVPATALAWSRHRRSNDTAGIESHYIITDADRDGLFLYPDRCTSCNDIYELLSYEQCRGLHGCTMPPATFAAVEPRRVREGGVAFITYLL